MKLCTVFASFVLLGSACAVVPDSIGDHAASPDATSKKALQTAGVGADGTTALLSPDRKPHDGGTGGTKTPCGSSLCADDQFCCNESCGLCAARGALCVQHPCGPDQTPEAQCASDDDCRTISNYCEGCQCLIVGADDPDPACHGTTVQCILDPCRLKHAGCINGTCGMLDN